MASKNSRIKSKGLVRYLICPTDKFFDKLKMWCSISTNYSKCVVDMMTFLQVRITPMIKVNKYNTT